MAGKPYCYYHSKMQQGLIEPEVRDSYPVFPLPKAGYVILIPTAVAA